MNKIRVIDLLNKIANGERFEKCKMKFKEIEPETVSEYVIYDRLYEEDLTLNDEVEIIEEKPKHIEDVNYDVDCTDEWNFGEIYDKLNELTKAVNYLLDKEKVDERRTI